MGPVELAILLADGLVIDAGEAARHVTVRVELPVLIAVGTGPMAVVIAIFILDAHGDAVASAGPERLLKPLIQFARPLAFEERHHFGAATQKLGSVASFGVLGAGERDRFGVPGIPGVLGHLDFVTRGLLGERQEW